MIDTIIEEVRRIRKEIESENRNDWNELLKNTLLKSKAKDT